MLHNPTHWLGGFIPEGRREAIDRWAAALPAETLLEAEWNGDPVGAWSRSTSFSHFRCSALDPDNAEMVRVFREQVRSTALAVEGIDVALDRLQPDTVVLLNGRFFAHWAMVERCKQRGIRFVTHERGMRKDTVRFAEQCRTHELDQNRQMWQQWEEIPLSLSELEATRQVLLDRRYGRNSSWLSFSPPPQEASRIRQAYRLDDRPILAVFNSSPDEVAAYPARREGAFPVSGQFLDAVKGLAEAHPEWLVVVRIHPNIAGQTGMNQECYAQTQRLLQAGVENLRVVLPEVALSSYTLADMAQAGLVYGSTIGLEMATAGMPVAHCANSTYAHIGCTQAVTAPEELDSTMARLMTRGRELETARRAFRWAYRYFSHFSLPYGLVREEPQHFGRLCFSNTNELMEGADPTLDRICDFLQGKAPLYALPTAEQRARQDVEETRFLNELLELSPV
jgi:hypothetical protein